MNIYEINYVLDPRKVLKFKSENSQPLQDWLYGTISEKLQCFHSLKLETSFNVLCVIICSEEEISCDEMNNLIDRISKESDIGNVDIKIKSLTIDETLRHTGIDEQNKGILKQILSGELPDKEPQKETAKNKDDEKPVEKYNQDEDDVFKSIESLISAEELKSWSREMQTILDKKLEPDVLNRSLMSMSYLVSVNRGNGSSTVFESIGKVVAKIIGKKDAIVKEFSVEPDENSNAYNVNKILGEIGHVDGGGNNLYVFALWINKFQNNKFGTEWFKLLSNIRERKGKILIIFALPYLEKMAIRDAHDRIEDIMPNRTISIKPMTNDDYISYFERYFKKCNLKIAEGVYPFITKLIAQEKSDGRFYGINTIEKICDEISYIKMINSAKNSTENDSVVVEDIKPMISGDNDVDGDVLSGLQKLDAMISLDGVKKRIKEVIATVQMKKSMDSDSSTSMHMMFSGAPGTGKTVVARILGEIMREEKILSTGGFYEVSRKDLVGNYVGHTAPKTAEACKLAYGGILFIDEAYLLDGGGENDFGKEAIGTLIAEMENKRGDMVVIFAGYEKELEKLFDLNPGLRDRIPYKIHFDNYNREELRQIFYKMIPGRFSYNEEFDETVKDFFDNLSDDIIESPHFSNGRFVRNLVERVMSKVALRMQMEGLVSDKYEITSVDFNAAVSDGEFSNLNHTKKVSRIGYYL